MMIENPSQLMKLILAHVSFAQLWVVAQNNNMDDQVEYHIIKYGYILIQ